ncbi:tetratricopeptide repeat protein [Pseudanabaena sp. PCC 6802]|uniref:tetratricopeptide repeat protein n=1 Tax=Pseudanabaena sp. PCC 6802 TaxID=118173 RepID=UPI0003468DDE|nr:tetratricopeptide repeat protein [Pseudanabaena sp. PCC 6802]
MTIFIYPFFHTPYPSPTFFAQANQNRAAEADRLRLLGNWQYRAHQFKSAVDSWQKALIVYREIKDRSGEAKSLHNLGLGHNLLGLHQKAIAFLEESLTISRELKDNELAAKSLSTLGDAHSALGHYKQALEAYQQALPIYKEISDRNCAQDSKSQACVFTRKWEEFIRARIDKIQKSLKAKRVSITFMPLGDL